MGWCSAMVVEARALSCKDAISWTASEDEGKSHQEIEEALLKLYLTLPYIIIDPMCIHIYHSDIQLDHVSYCLGEL